MKRKYYSNGDIFQQYEDKQPIDNYYMIQVKESFERKYKSYWNFWRLD